MATKLADLTVAATTGAWSSGALTMTAGSKTVTLRRKSDGAVLATRSFTVGSSAVAVTDDFNRATTFNANGDWTAISGFSLPGLSSNKAIGAGAAYWSGDTFAANQYAQAVVSTVSPASSASAHNSVAVRVSGTNRYELRATQLYYDDPDFLRFWVISLYKNGTLVATFEDSTVGCDTARTLRIEATGTSTTQIVCKVDGATVDTRNDSSSPNTTGAPGLILSAAGYALADNFAAGDI